MFSLPHYSARDGGIIVDTIIIHSMCNPNSTKPTAIESCIEILDQHKVSAHYLISPRGKIVNLVADEHAAWHAGESKMPGADGRSKVNQFSIGIELLNEPGKAFTASQYQALTKLTVELMSRHKIRAVLGHDQVAQPPGRKTDPGELFDWKRFRSSVQALGAIPNMTEIIFGRL